MTNRERAYKIVQDFLNAKVLQTGEDLTVRIAQELNKAETRGLERASKMLWNRTAFGSIYDQYTVMELIKVLDMEIKERENK